MIGGSSRGSGRWLASGPDLGGEKVRFQLLFFVQFAAFSGFVVFRNVYLEEMGMSGSAMGQIGFLLMATGVVAQPIWGVVTDYWRAERAVLIVGAAVSGVGMLAYPLGNAVQSTFLVVALGSAVLSAFRAPIIPIVNGMILARGYDYGNIRSFGSVAVGIGSLGFGFLVAALGTASIVYFYVGGAAVVVAIVLSISPTPEGDDDATDSEGDATDLGDGDATDLDADATETTDADELGRVDTDPDGDVSRSGAVDRAGDPSTDGGTAPDPATREDHADPDEVEEAEFSTAVRTLVTNPTFLVLLCVAFLFRASVSGGMAFVSVYMRQVDAALVVGPWSLSPDALTGIAWTARTFFEAAAFVFAVRLGLSYRVLLVLGGVLGMVPNVAHGLTTDPLVLLAAHPAGGVGFALVSLSAVNVAFAVADLRIKSTAQTLLTGIGLGLGAAVGQIVAGSLMDLVGIQRMFLYVAAIGLVGALAGLLVRHEGTLEETKAARA